MKMMRSGIVLFVSMFVVSFVFYLLTNALSNARVPGVVIALSALLFVGSAFATYGGVVLAVAGWAVRDTDNWMPTGLRLFLTGVALFLLVEIVGRILEFLRLPDILQGLLGGFFILSTITVALSGLFLVGADIARMVGDRNRGSRA